MKKPPQSTTAAALAREDKCSFSGAMECDGLWPPSILRMQGVRIATALRASQ